MSETLGVLAAAAQQLLPDGGFILVGQPTAPGSNKYTYGAVDPATFATKTDLAGYATNALVTTVSAQVTALASAVTGIPAALVCGMAVNGHRALMLDPTTGLAVPADPSLPGYNFAGIAVQAAGAGASVLVAVAGQTVVEPSWSWQPGTPLFLGAGGVVSSVPPSSGVLQQIGQALTASSMLVQPFPPVTLN